VFSKVPLNDVLCLWLCSTVEGAGNKGATRHCMVRCDVKTLITLVLNNFTVKLDSVVRLFILYPNIPRHVRYVSHYSRKPCFTGEITADGTR
jgi:hypothetical protein